MKSCLKGPTSERRKEVRPVAFNELTIYTFRNRLGGDACCSEGCPISMDRKHHDVDVVTVEQHEFLRKTNPRRRRKDLIMKSGERDA